MVAARWAGAWWLQGDVQQGSEAEGQWEAAAHLRPPPWARAACSAWTSTCGATGWDGTAVHSQAVGPATHLRSLTPLHGQSVLRHAAPGPAHARAVPTKAGGGAQPGSGAQQPTCALLLGHRQRVAPGPEHAVRPQQVLQGGRALRPALRRHLPVVGCPPARVCVCVCCVLCTCVCVCCVLCVCMCVCCVLCAVRCVCLCMRVLCAA